MEQNQVLNEIILGYRKVIEERYDYKNIQFRSDFPTVFNEESVDKFKNYFLKLYPLPDKREELNDAFENLQAYVRQPEKLLRLLIDSTSLMFKYGRHLPKILIAGLTAIQSFRRTNSFEEKLVAKAVALGLEKPYGKPEINQLIQTLSLEEIDEFIGGNIKLFETLKDRKLVDSIEKIVSHLIQRMKNRPNIYAAAEINGLEIGHEIIAEGNSLFQELGKENEQKVFDFIINLEREVLDELFG